MQFSTIAVFLATLALSGSGLANPLPVDAAPEAALDARAADPLIDLWADAKFLGLKHTGKGAKGDCVNLPNDFRNIITSGKSRNNLRCTVWEKTGCSGTGFSFINSPKFDSWIDNKAKSWKCVQ